MGERHERLDDALAGLDPRARIAELEHQIRVLRAQRNREIRHIIAREFAQELLALGARRAEQNGHF